MGSFAYLINKERKICQEAYQHSASGNVVNIITEPELLAAFIDYCRENGLVIESVMDVWFVDEMDLGNPDYKPYTDFSEIYKSLQDAQV